MARQPSQLPSKRNLNELSDNELRMWIQDIFVKSLIFKVALGISHLGALLIGAVSFSSSWIALNVHDVVTHAQTELQNTKDDLVRTEGEYKEVRTQLDNGVNEAKQQMDEVVRDVKNTARMATEQAAQAANDARDSIPNIVSAHLAAQKDNLDKALSDEEQKAIKEFHNAAEEIEKKHERALSTTLDETVPQNSTNILVAWIDSWPWWLRWTLYVVVPVVIIGIVIAFFVG
jgi:hypothetical protein